MKIVNLLVSAALMTGLANMAVAADKVLTVASWLPPTHSVNAALWPKVKKELEARTDGRVSLSVEYNLAPPKGLLELVEYGGADISWTYNGYFPGRFTTTKMIELPGYPGNSEVASYAHWKAHQKFFTPAKEFEGVKLIGFMLHAPSHLMMKEEIKSLNDLKGRKMRLGGGITNDVAKILDVSPVVVPAPKTYEYISGGMADGTILPMGTAALAFRLYEVAPFAYSVPGGFYRGSFSIFMNEDALEGVSDKDKKAINEYFGEKLSVDGGKAWDEVYNKGLQVYEEKAKVMPLSQADVSNFGVLATKVKEKIINEVNEKGIDGQAAYDFIMETMKSYK